MSEIPLTTPRKELPPQGREEWDALREVRVSPEEAKIISKVLLAKWQSIFYVVPVMPVWKKLIFSKTQPLRS